MRTTAEQKLAAILSRERIDRAALPRRNLRCFKMEIATQPPPCFFRINLTDGKSGLGLAFEEDDPTGFAASDSVNAEAFYRVEAKDRFLFPHAGGCDIPEGGEMVDSVGTVFHFGR
jgi:hypothetical protein